METRLHLHKALTPVQVTRRKQDLLQMKEATIKAKLAVGREYHVIEHMEMKGIVNTSVA